MRGGGVYLYIYIWIHIHIHIYICIYMRNYVHTWRNPEESRRLEITAFSEATWSFVPFSAILKFRARVCTSASDAMSTVGSGNGAYMECNLMKCSA